MNIHNSCYALEDRRRASSLHRSRKSIIVLCVMSLLVAGMVVATPAAGGQLVIVQSQQTGWHFNDDPVFGPDGANVGWRGGDPESRGHGYGPAKYFNNSNYAFASAENGWNPRGSWARWEMGTRIGTQEIQAYIPGNDASARVKYAVIVGFETGSVIDYSDWVNQEDEFGWHSLGRFSADGGNVTIEVRYDDSRTAIGRTGARWRSVGIDAVRMRCVVDCTGVDNNVSPSLPRNVKASPHGENRLRVTWDAPANTGGSPIGYYGVQYSRPELKNHPTYGDRKEYTSRWYWPNGTVHTSSGLLKGVTYTIKVRAINTAGNVGNIASTTGTTRSDVDSLRAELESLRQEYSEYRTCMNDALHRTGRNIAMNAEAQIIEMQTLVTAGAIPIIGTLITTFANAMSPLINNYFAIVDRMWELAGEC